MRGHSNRDIVDHFIEALNRGDMDAAAECFAEDACNFGRRVGREGIRRVLMDIHATFPDIRLDILDVLAVGDWNGEHFAARTLVWEGCR
jgi:ketosteroid isomerase-like protein